MLRRLDIPVVKSRGGSLDKLARGSVLVIAEPRPSAANEQTMRDLLKADTILLVLPKWIGRRNEQKPEWLREALRLPASESAWALHLVAPRADVAEAASPAWLPSLLSPAPNLAEPVELMRGGALTPIIADKEGILLGLVSERQRRVWVLSDPDLIANHGLARAGNAALVVAMLNRIRGPTGSVVFDETVHGFAAQPANPLLLLFRFPFVMAVIPGVIAVALLLWATLGRFGAPQPAPPPLSAGRLALLQSIAKLVEATGHQEPMVRRYVLETMRDAARQLHAPRGLSAAALTGWLQRVGAARGVEIDCGSLVREAEALGDGRRRNPAPLVRLARRIHRWKREIIDGRSGHPRGR